MALLVSFSANCMGFLLVTHCSGHRITESFARDSLGAVLGFHIPKILLFYASGLACLQAGPEGRYHSIETAL